MNPIRRTALIITLVAVGIGFAIGATVAYHLDLWLLGGFK